MAYFIGTEKDFKRYIGPILRNLVQQITKDYRRQIGKCQLCGTTHDLEAAHVHGKDRNTIISNLLESYKAGSEYIVSLSEFEKQFRSHHAQVEESILILCKQCHYEYDKGHGGLIYETEVFKKENRNTNIPFQEKSELKIGKYVQKTFNEIINKIDRSELENLQRQDYSKTVFDLQFPFLRKVQKSDSGKPLRYWKKPVRIMGELYFMCSEWYEKEPNNDRPFYERWLSQMRKK